MTPTFIIEDLCLRLFCMQKVNAQLQYAVMFSAKSRGGHVNCHWEVT